MRSFHQIISILAIVLLNTLALAQNIDGDDADSLADSLVTVSMSGHAPIDLILDPNGELAHANLESRTYVDTAMVNNPGATCFFGVKVPNHNLDFISQRFTSHHAAGIDHDVDGVYCFDHRRDLLDRKTFGLFLQSDSGDKEFVRMRIPENKGFAELIMAEHKPDLSDYKTVSLIIHPMWNLPTDDNVIRMPECTVIEENGREQHTVPWPFPMTRASGPIEMIRCFPEMRMGVYD